MSAKLITRLSRLSKAIRRAPLSPFAADDEVLELLARLPDDDVARLTRALDRADPTENVDLDGLAAMDAELGAAARDATRKVELLRALALKAGRMSDDLAAAFARLARPGGLDLEDVRKIVDALPEGHGEDFARAVSRLDPAEIRPGGDFDAAFLLLLAGSPNRSTKRIDALIAFGPKAYLGAARRAGGRSDVLDGYARVLEALDEEAAQKGYAAYAKFVDDLDKLVANDPADWLRIENKRRALSGRRPIDKKLLDLGEGNDAASKDAAKGLDRLARGDHDDVIYDLADDLVDSNPQEIAAFKKQLKAVGELDDKQARGLAVLRKVDEEGDLLSTNTRGQTWRDILDFDNDALRGPLLDELGDIDPNVVAGLDAALKPAFARGLRNVDPLAPDAQEVIAQLPVKASKKKPKLTAQEAAKRSTLVQGVLGHLAAVKDVLRKFPGARLQLEVSQANPYRIVDIRAVLPDGRTIDFEVKTWFDLDPNSRQFLSFVVQLRKDLVANLSNGWRRIAYLFKPDPNINLAHVTTAMLDELTPAKLAEPNNILKKALDNAGLTPQQATDLLNQRLALPDPPPLVSKYAD